MRGSKRARQNIPVLGQVGGKEDTGSGEKEKSLCSRRKELETEINASLLLLFHCRS